MTSKFFDDTPKRSTLESVIRFFVWSAVIGCIGLPVLLTAMVYFQIYTTFPFSRGSDAFQRTIGALSPSTDPGLPRPDITTNVLDKERLRQMERLGALTARPEMSSGGVIGVQFIAVKFEDIKPDAAEATTLPHQRVDTDGYRRLTLDMTAVPREAVVLVSDQPVRWRITGLQPRSWPRIGFEGYAAFDVADGQPGTLAGFRIGMFGAKSVMQAVDPSQGQVSNRQTLCSSVERWTYHFGIPFSSSQFTLLLNPTTVSPRSGVPRTDGEIAKNLFSQDVVWLCRRNTSGR